VALLVRLCHAQLPKRRNGARSRVDFEHLHE
jgi:hypothetical protein